MWSGGMDLRPLCRATGSGATRGSPPTGWSRWEAGSGFTQDTAARSLDQSSISSPILKIVFGSFPFSTLCCSSFMFCPELVVLYCWRQMLINLGLKMRNIFDYEGYSLNELTTDDIKCEKIACPSTLKPKGTSPARGAGGAKTFYIAGPKCIHSFFQRFKPKKITRLHFLRSFWDSEKYSKLKHFYKNDCSLTWSVLKNQTPFAFSC